MKDMLYAVLALISVIAAGFFFYTYVNQGETEANRLPFFAALACTLVALILGALFLSGRVNKTEDIHITE